jgi:AcrR family transcriptional regulator
MTHAGTKADRISRRQVDKFAERRSQLAAAALKTLSELGYARTSLREIAQNSDFSHGVLHYYFADKVDLITCCVRQYKAVCVQRYDEIVAVATTAPGLLTGFATGLSTTLVEDATLHRLWYDLRNQSQFESSYRQDVSEIDASLRSMIWRIVTRYAELAGTTPGVTPSEAYAVFDGAFQHALWSQLAGNGQAAGALEDSVAQLLPRLMVVPAGG